MDNEVKILFGTGFFLAQSPSQPVVVAFFSLIHLHFSTMHTECYLWHLKEVAWPLIWISENLIITQFASKSFCFLLPLLPFFNREMIFQFNSTCKYFIVLYKYDLYVNALIPFGPIYIVCTYQSLLPQMPSFSKRRFVSFLLTDTNPIWILLTIQILFYFIFLYSDILPSGKMLLAVTELSSHSVCSKAGRQLFNTCLKFCFYVFYGNEGNWVYH